LGNFNNSGTINLIDSSSKFNFLGTITNSNTGVLQITGGIVKDLKTTGGVVKMTGGTFAGNISIKSEFETSNSTGVTITQLADSVINVETNRFWINYTTTDGGAAKYSGFEKQTGTDGVLPPRPDGQHPSECIYNGGSPGSTGFLL